MPARLRLAAAARSRSFLLVPASPASAARPALAWSCKTVIVLPASVEQSAAVRRLRASPARARPTRAGATDKLRPRRGFGSGGSVMTGEGGGDRVTG